MKTKQLEVVLKWFMFNDFKIYDFQIFPKNKEYKVTRIKIEASEEVKHLMADNKYIILHPEDENSILIGKPKNLKRYVNDLNATKVMQT